MAKGSIAKDVVKEKIIQAFGANYVGEADKKLYVQAQENGEWVQIAISMTCPKTPIAASAVAPVEDSGDWDFSGDASSTVRTAVFEPAQITKEEEEAVQELMKRLNL